MSVHYNYPLMQQIAADLARCGATAEGLLASSTASKNSLRGTFDGDAARVFDDSFMKYAQVNQDISEITRRGSMAYDSNTAAMSSAEQSMMGTFPG